MNKKDTSGNKIKKRLGKAWLDINEDTPFSFKLLVLDTILHG